jgi:hypothetical protein
MATRWAILAADEDEAWRALRPMRGLRVPGRDQGLDPTELGRRADAMPRADVLGLYPMAADAGALTQVYRPLVTDLAADYVSIQVMSERPEAAIEMVGSEVLPGLRGMAGAPVP